MTKARILFACTIVLVSMAAVHADEWLAPRIQNIFSSNNRYFVRIVPATSINVAAPATATLPPDGPADGARAHAEFYAQQVDRSYRRVADVPLRNRVSPAYAIVTNDGYLVTFDDWFRIGMGDAIAFYRPDGALIRAVTVDELYTPDRLADIPRSTSSRWWRCAVFYTAAERGGLDTLTVSEHFGGVFSLNSQTGTFSYMPGHLSCESGRATTF